MGFFYEQNSGSKGVIYDEGNNIILMPIGGRLNRQMVIARDYRSELCFLCDRTKVCISYFNTQNDLVWHTVGEGERIVLLSGVVDTFEISNIKIEKINGIIYVFYMIRKAGNVNSEIKFISPMGNRNTKSFYGVAASIENYKFSDYDNEKLFEVKLAGEKNSRKYKVQIDDAGKVEHEEYKLKNSIEVKELNNQINNMKNIISEKEEYILKLEEELSNKNIYIVEETKKLKNESLHKAQEEYEEMLKKEITKIEVQYKKQYDELGKLTKEIQEEGKRWRELYYKNVKN